MRTERPTGHSGRHTLSSGAINNGVDLITVSKTTHRKDVNELEKYVKLTGERTVELRWLLGWQLKNRRL